MRVFLSFVFLVFESVSYWFYLELVKILEFVVEGKGVFEFILLYFYNLVFFKENNIF